MADRLHFIEEEAGQTFWTTIYQVAYCTFGICGTEIAGELVDRWLEDRAVLYPALQTLPDNPTTGMGLALLQAAHVYPNPRP